MATRKVDALSFIVHKEFAYERGKPIVDTKKTYRQCLKHPFRQPSVRKSAWTDIKAL